MNTHPDPRSDGRHDSAHETERDAAFDAAARAAHADALQHLSARIHVQLQQRRRAALAGEAHATRPLWQRTGPLLALGGTAALALAIGLRFAGDTAESGTSAEAGANVAIQAEDAAMAAPSTPTTTALPALNPPDTATAAASTGATEPDAADSVRAATPELVDATMRESDALLAEAVGEPTDGDANLMAANDDAAFDGAALDSAAFDRDALAALEENPDLYLWLASEDGQPDAVESL